MFFFQAKEKGLDAFETGVVFSCYSIGGAVASIVTGYLVSIPFNIDALYY